MLLPMIPMPGFGELMIILFIVMILFGAGKLPQVGRQLGSAISEFKSSVKDKEDEEDTTVRKEKEEAPQP